MAKSAAWGYIEGYYGRLFSWEERAALLDHLAELGGNAYLYAPKEDTLHRRDWRIPYGAAWKRNFSALVARGARSGARVIPGLAPGLSYRYLDGGDYRTLLRKFRSFAALGCRTLALLMDDITPELPKDARGSFRSLGEAHGLLLERLRKDLGDKIELWFCPTVYTDQFASGPVEKDRYLLDLAETMPRDVALMWTGPRIISPSLSARDIAGVTRMFRGNVILWDNLYANDYCPNKIFLGPYADRSSDLWKKTRGILLNPTGLPLTDRFLLGLLRDHKRGLGSAAAWKRALAALEVPAGFGAVARFLASPFFTPSSADLSPRRLAALRKALKPLIWDWKGPLHREWYPHLFMLDADLKASQGGAEAPDAAWIRKRYSPLVARLLLRR